MATILLQAAGTALGGVLGPFGAVVGRAAGALAGSVIDRTLINGTSTVSGRRLSDARISGADEGAAITRAYGTVRIGGTLIWATRFEEEATSERQGGKAGGARVETFRYFGNFALGICEGPIAGIRRVWADGRELDLTTVEMRVYRGTASQAADPLIEAKQGTDKAPAYRNLAYVVFERLPLDVYGNRLPLIQFEVMRVTGALESQIRAVTLIPGSSEYGYDPAVVSDVTGPGTRRLINRNVFHGASDWAASIDELQALCPNLERVALVVSWFGTDLRAGVCKIRPGVETATRKSESKVWSVSGIERDEAYLVSSDAGAPAYGGTPSDASVVAAIADLKARGLKVYLYPFVMMDVANGNILPDPYGGTAQAAYPWRGRITCHPAPGVAGTVDRTAAARAQVAAFCGDTAVGDFTLSGTSVTAHAGDEGFRRLILHYAHLADRAGGVDGFIIGSEMRGLTRVRDGTDAFPFVEALMALAGDVRGIVGSATKLTYAADWSEYTAYRPPGQPDVLIYNLDPLWAHAAIDAVGIDNYLPLSDWRDEDRGTGNPDGFLHAEDGAAMRVAILSGEGYDWFYASEADRLNRVRTAITDGLENKPWVFRAKDIPGWWSNLHYGRDATGENFFPSAWVPGMKPVWFTEIGCPAIDKGANQPNVFTDPKSSESFTPYFSSGARSDAMQRRFLEAQLGFWEDEDAPSCVDPDHIFVWTWDARPAPAFPENTALWSDGTNWRTGHWLNGRLGTGTVADIVAAVLADHGFSRRDVSRVAGDLTGYVQGDLASARDVLEPLMAALSIDAVDRGGLVALRSRLELADAPQVIDVFAEVEDAALFEETRAHGSDFAAEAVLDHLDASRSYEQATTRSRRRSTGNDRVLRLSLPGVLHEDAAGAAVEDVLRDHQLSRSVIRFDLPANRIAVEPGDLVRIAGGPAGPYIVTRIEDGQRRVVEARAFQPASGRTKRRALPATAARGLPASGFAPVVHLMDLPHQGSGSETSFARAAVFARPWTAVQISSSPLSEGYRARVRVDRPARAGALVEALGPGVSGRFDRVNAVVLDLYYGGLASMERIAVLAGENRIAIRANNGAFEILAFLAAEEISAGRWRLSGLLRGLLGSEDAMMAGSAVGADVVVLDGAVQPLALLSEEAGRTLNWIVEASGGAPAGPFAFAGGLRALTPLSPVHLKARRSGGDVVFSWVRRARLDADHWLESDIALDEPAEKYRLEILDGGTVTRVIEATGPGATYLAADEIADFGAPQSLLAVRVRQRGGKVALGLPATASLAV